MTKQRTLPLAALTASLMAAIGCVSQTQPVPKAQDSAETGSTVEPESQGYAPRTAYFGDLHVHTKISADSYVFANDNGLEDAYEFAMGARKPIGDEGIDQQLPKPLDFAAITDHSESFGYYARCVEDGYDSELCQDIRDKKYAAYDFLYKEFGKEPPPPIRDQATCPEGITGQKGCYHDGLRIWKAVQTAAKKYNSTDLVTFVAYEYSPIFDGGMLHRNVIFKNDQVPDLPRDVYNTKTAKHLRDALDRDCRNNKMLADCDVVVIPHNANWTWGAGFATVDRGGEAISREDFQQRLELEPLIEIIQVKGASECGVGIGNTKDELCDFEKLFEPCEDQDGIGGPGQQSAEEPEICTRRGSFARSGLKLGLELTRDPEYKGLNPFKFGFIGSTDTHNGTPGATVESDWKGHEGNEESTPEKRLSEKIGYNPGGLAGVWATKKTRGAIFKALQDREAFGTSGTRITVRFFGSWTYDSDLPFRPDWERTAYQAGVPMGGDMPKSTGGNPRFLIWAQKEPSGTDLQRVQVVKGWTNRQGEALEEVIDVSCAGGATPKRGQSCQPPAFNPMTCDQVSEGSEQLYLVWEDEEFDPSKHAFYYLRVLEMPTCRWSAHDKNSRIQSPGPEDVVQERAWSSPIWYSPPSL